MDTGFWLNLSVHNTGLQAAILIERPKEQNT